MSFIYSFVVVDDDVSYRYLLACYYCYYYYWSSNLRVHILTFQAEHSINIYTHTRTYIQFFSLIEILRTSVNVVEQIEKRKDSLSQMMNVVGNVWCKVTNPWSLSSCHHLKPCRVHVWSFFFNYSFVLMGAHEHTYTLFFSLVQLKIGCQLEKNESSFIDQIFR